MKWYEGGIPAAIQAARQNKAVFIVFISGEDDKSAKMESELNQQRVTQLSEEHKCVAVKLISESNDCKFFSQIYPVVVIPSTYFIGDTGAPLEVIGEVASSEDFHAKVKAALEMQKNRTLPQSHSQSEQSQPPASQEKPSSSSMSTESGANSDGSGDDSAIANQVETASASPSTSASAGAQLDLDDKVERAKQLLEEKQQEKARKEFEDQKRKEIERRGVGQGVQKLRQTQKEMDILEAKKELKRDKEEDRLARQRVKEEIAQDRAEKAARFQREKDERARAAEEAKKKKLAEQQAVLSAEQAMRSEISRIQFRLPDGSSVTQQFPAKDTFEAVYNFITGHVGSSVTLSTTFPRRTFTSSDHSQTLQELNLAPSAAILVLPGSQSSSGVRSSSGALSLTSIVFAPFTFLWNIIASLFGYGGSSTPPAARSNESTAASSARGGDRRPDSAYQRGSSASRPEGSIHRFRNAQDDENDDDRNTWNGNSTQQM